MQTSLQSISIITPETNPTHISSHSPSLSKTPSPRLPLIYFLSLWNRLFWTFPISGVPRYVFSGVWPLSRSVVCSRFIHAASRLSRLLCPRFLGSPCLLAVGLQPVATGSPLHQGFPNTRLPSLWNVLSAARAGSRHKAPSAPCLLPQEIHFSVLSTI